MEFVTITPEIAMGPLNSVEVKNAPAFFHLRGDATLLSEGRRVSIVGSRKASADALRRARSLTRLLVKDGVVIVSGLAEGIDTAAHLQAIESGGKTIGVIGTPLDQSFPAANRALQERIAQEQLLVSQFEIGSFVGRKNFPIRNRTMALISDATVIVEAADGSGSLHQGWEALRLGRPLFLMESILNNVTLKWPGEMIQYGARVLSKESVDELMDLLPKVNRAQLASFEF